MLMQKTLARFVVGPENRAALHAVHDLHRPPLGQTHSILLLHGPPGSGKSHLVSGLCHELCKGKSRLVVHYLSASDARENTAPRGNGTLERESPNDGCFPKLGDEALGADLLIVEDLQHLPLAANERLVQVLDERKARRLTTVLTADAGPRRLSQRGKPLPARLRSRLAGGLVVALQRLQAPSRIRLLRELAQQQQLAVPDEIVKWLGQNLAGGGRQLAGAVAQLAALQKATPEPLTLDTIRTHFQALLETSEATVDRIVEQVGGYFQTDPRRLRSAVRVHSVLLPRQISMYLARHLTRLSLGEIGAYFGGKDHSTVRHACHKVQKALTKDPLLASAVAEIQTELT
ncbi:MAG: DnaA/Hda family protein [Gemmataceae bacterium]|nr:DnaA/Hda family protein [Gemmataceae bacterium]